MGIKIQELIDKTMEKGVSVWVEYPDIEGFKIKVAYVSSEDMFKMSDSSKKTEWVKHQKTEVLDRALINKKWANKAILDWEGLTLGKLAKILPIEVPAADMNAVVVCDEDNRFTLVYRSLAFNNWITEVSTDVDLFADEIRKRRESVDEAKK